MKWCEKEPLKAEQLRRCFFFGVQKTYLWGRTGRLGIGKRYKALFLSVFGTLMGVSENSGTPKSSILIGFSIINHPFWGTTIFGNTLTGVEPQEMDIIHDWRLGQNGRNWPGTTLFLRLFQHTFGTHLWNTPRKKPLLTGYNPVFFEKIGTWISSSRTKAGTLYISAKRWPHEWAEVDGPEPPSSEGYTWDMGPPLNGGKWMGFTGVKSPTYNW